MRPWKPVLMVILSERPAGGPRLSHARGGRPEGPRGRQSSPSGRCQREIRVGDVWRPSGRSSSAPRMSSRRTRRAREVSGLRPDLDGEALLVEHGPILASHHGRPLRGGGGGAGWGKAPVPAPLHTGIHGGSLSTSMSRRKSATGRSLISTFGGGNMSRTLRIPALSGLLGFLAACGEHVRRRHSLDKDLNLTPEMFAQRQIQTRRFNTTD